MSRSEYAKYLSTQAYWLKALAEEVEAGVEVTAEWAIDWELRRESEFIDAKEAETCIASADVA